MVKKSFELNSRFNLFIVGLQRRQDLQFQLHVRLTHSHAVTQRRAGPTKVNLKRVDV